MKKYRYETTEKIFKYIMSLENEKLITNKELINLFAGKIDDAAVRKALSVICDDKYLHRLIKGKYIVTKNKEDIRKRDFYETIKFLSGKIEAFNYINVVPSIVNVLSANSLTKQITFNPYSIFIDNNAHYKESDILKMVNNLTISDKEIKNIYNIEKIRDLKKIISLYFNLIEYREHTNPDDLLKLFNNSYSEFILINEQPLNKEYKINILNTLVYSNVTSEVYKKIGEYNLLNKRVYVLKKKRS